jgi:peptidoglycan/LPS O-acetylase OafA/YrhL
MQPLSRRTDQHIAVLDGLRAAAILLVLMYHLLPGRESDEGLRSLFFKIADIGWSGVDLFFVLSGFLITTKLLAARDDEHRFRNFYVRRALRIFPLYYAVLLVLFVVGRPPLAAALPLLLYYSNFSPAALPTDVWAPTGHFWSLAVEEQFYLLWPAIIFLCRRRTAMTICIAVAVAAPLLRFALAANGFSWYATYASTPCRADGLVLGSLIALAGTNRRLAWLALSLTAPVAAWVTWRHKAYYVVETFQTPDAIALRALLPSVVSLMFAALLVLALEYQPRTLGIAPFRLVAKYSYGMYVAHFMLIPTLQRLLPLDTLTPNSGALLFFAAGSVASFVLAAISYHAFESIFLRAKPRFA